jgi:hypothetical protein
VNKQIGENNMDSHEYRKNSPNPTLSKVKFSDNQIIAYSLLPIDTSVDMPYYRYFGNSGAILVTDMASGKSWILYENGDTETRT